MKLHHMKITFPRVLGNITEHAYCGSLLMCDGNVRRDQPQVHSWLNMHWSEFEWSKQNQARTSPSHTFKESASVVATNLIVGPTHRLTHASMCSLSFQWLRSFGMNIIQRWIWYKTMLVIYLGGCTYGRKTFKNKFKLINMYQSSGTSRTDTGKCGDSILFVEEIHISMSTSKKRPFVALIIMKITKRTVFQRVVGFTWIYIYHPRRKNSRNRNLFLLHHL